MHIILKNDIPDKNPGDITKVFNFILVQGEQILTELT